MGIVVQWKYNILSVTSSHLLLFTLKKIFLQDEECTPKQSWHKDRLKKWLEAKNIFFPVKALKPELWQLARAKANQEPKYKVDDLIRSYGHDVLRLPPYHCELNPIERI